MPTLKYELFITRAAEAEKSAKSCTSELDRALWLQLAASYRALADNEQWLNGSVAKFVKNNPPDQPIQSSL